MDEIIVGETVLAHLDGRKLALQVGAVALLVGAASAAFTYYGAKGIVTRTFNSIHLTEMPPS